MSEDLIRMNLQLFAEDADEKEDVEENDKEDAGAEEKAKEKEDTTGAAEKKDAKTYTQAQLNKMMTKEKNQGRNAAFNEFGIDPKDTQAVAQFKAFLEAQKTDDQKAGEQKQADQAAIAALTQKATIAEAKVEAMRLGVQSQYVEDVITLAVSKMGEDGELKDIINEFKTKYPDWFKASEEDAKETVGKKGTGSSIKTNTKDKAAKEKGLGQRLAAQRNTSSKKTSYWGK